jgi:acyl carrier protein
VLEYLGRNDFQVKIRGFRVEPGEVEAVLQTYPGVKQAVVIAREDERGEKRLIGYVVADMMELKVLESENVDDAHAKTVSHLIPRLREFLSERMPQYMVPTAIVELDELPLTPNGKVDRHALPEPESDRHLEQPFVAASTSMEEALSGVWTQVLGLAQVGVDDNFFELGGDSLMGMELVTKVAERLGVQELSIIALFEYPTIREMAQFVEATLSVNVHSLESNHIGSRHGAN